MPAFAARTPAYELMMATVDSPVARGIASVIMLAVAVFLATRPHGPPRGRS